MKSRIHTGPVAGLTLGGYGKGIVKELQIASVRLLLVFLLE